MSGSKIWNTGWGPNCKGPEISGGNFSELGEVIYVNYSVVILLCPLSTTVPLKVRFPSVRIVLNKLLYNKCPMCTC